MMIQVNNLWTPGTVPSYEVGTCLPTTKFVILRSAVKDMDLSPTSNKERWNIALEIKEAVCEKLLKEIFPTSGTTFEIGDEVCEEVLKKIFEIGDEVCEEVMKEIFEIGDDVCEELLNEHPLELS